MTDVLVEESTHRLLPGSSPSEPKTVCAGHPLPLDRPAPAPDAMSKAATSAYVDAEQARRIIDRFREHIANR